MTELTGQYDFLRLYAHFYDLWYTDKDYAAEVYLSHHPRNNVSEIEWITHRDEVLAIVIPAAYQVQSTEFITPNSFKQQVGFVVYPSDGIIAPHLHHELERNLRGMSEVLLVRQGRCHVDLYRQDKSLHCSRELHTGDVIVLVSGGHGFRMIEDTVFLEIKQGPYLGDQEKQRF